MYNFDPFDLNYRLIETSGIDQISNDIAQARNVSNEPAQQRNWVLHFASGMISGPLSRTMTAPLDRMRLQIQVHPVKQSIPEVWHSIMNNGGVLGLWRGNFINVIKVGPEMAIRFSVFDRIKEYFLNAESGMPIPIYKRFISGALAGMCGQFAVYPMETVKTRMMVRKPGQYKHIFDCIYKTYMAEGPRGFYRGYLASMIGILPYTGVDLTIYDVLKNKFIFSTLQEGERPATWKLLLCACISITLGQYSSYPFYLVKARQQAKSKHVSLTTAPKGRCQICTILATVLKEDGFTGLYRGVILTLFKVLPAGVINYIIYEHARRTLGPYFEYAVP